MTATASAGCNVQYLHVGIGVTYQRLMWSDFIGQEPCSDPSRLHRQRRGVHRPGVSAVHLWPGRHRQDHVANPVLKELVKRISATPPPSPRLPWKLSPLVNSQEEKQRFGERFMYLRCCYGDDYGQGVRRTACARPPSTNIPGTRRAGRTGPHPADDQHDPQEVKTGYGAAVLSLLRSSPSKSCCPVRISGSTAHDRTVAEVRSKEVRPIV